MQLTALSSWGFALRLLPLLLLLGSSLPLAAQYPVPQATNDLVNDYAGIIPPGEEAQLRQELEAYARRTSTQIAVVTEPKLNGMDAFDRSYQIAKEWGIGGSEQKDNGVLIYVARDDRKIRIQTGYGAEGFLPDVLAKRVIDNIMTPAFRAGNFGGGIREAARAIMELGEGEYEGEALDDRPSGGIPPVLILFLILVFFMLLSYFGNRNNYDDDDDDEDGGYWRNGPYDMDEHERRRRRKQRRRSRGPIFFPFPMGGGGFGGGGGGGGFGGGGFGGFGGGGFGGGGAGGGW